MIKIASFPYDFFSVNSKNKLIEYFMENAQIENDMQFNWNNFDLFKALITDIKSFCDNGVSNGFESQFF